MEWTKNWLLFVSKAAAYLGFMMNALQRVFRISSNVDSVSTGSLSAFIVKMSTPSLTISKEGVRHNRSHTLLLVRLIAPSSVTVWITL